MVQGLRACSETSEHNDWGGQPFSLVDPKLQEVLLLELEREEIEFEFDSRGFIRYGIDNQARVSGIRRKFEFGAELDPSVFETQVFYGEYSRELYEQALAREEIPYRMYERSDAIFIEYSQLYGPAFDAISQEVDKKSLEKMRKDAGSRRYSDAQ